VWRFYEPKHPHSLWHGDLMEKVTLTDEDRTAYQLTLQDDYSRAYVFCDLYREPTVNTTIGAMIVAMREYHTIPKAVVFDNGPTFSGRLLSAFCLNLDIRLIYTSVRHPQTNGKLERAFRDDMNEFYRQRERWIFSELRRNLPEYFAGTSHWAASLPSRAYKSKTGSPFLRSLSSLRSMRATELESERWMKSAACVCLAELQVWTTGYGGKKSLCMKT
jgi:transposase InsO family protein